MKNLVRGFLLAHNAPQEVLATLSMLEEPPPLNWGPSKETTIEEIFEDLNDCDNGCRITNALKNEGIDSIEKLTEYRKLDLLKVPNFGRKSLSELENVLENYGIHLKGPIYS